MRGVKNKSERESKSEQIIKNRQVSNSYEMLKYLYPEISGKRFGSMDISVCNNLNDLYALVIATWSMSLAKEGLYKEYVAVEDDELTSPRGQINIAESISRQTQLRGALVCSYDELSEDIYLNRVVKGTLQYLLYDEDINENVHVSLMKAMQSYNGMGVVDIHFLSWKDVKFNNNNIRYKNLIDICKTLYFDLETSKKHELDDGVRMYNLFKRQLLKYYFTEYVDDTVELFEQPYTLDSESEYEKSIYPLQKMVAIRCESHAVLIEIRLLDSDTLTNNKLSKARQQELADYCALYSKLFRVKTNGAIIYVNTDPKKLNLAPITTNSVSGTLIGEVIVDINDFWRYIKNKVNDIYKTFIYRYKKKVNA